MSAHPAGLLPTGRPVLVWGNCQAAPVASLLREPLAAHGCEVVDVPPVFEADEADLVRVREVLREGAALVSQPVRDEYHVAGCGTRQLAERLPSDALLVTFPVTYDTGPFPCSANGHGADGHRVVAPVTDYHDLRAITAAARGLGLEEALAWWPAPPAETVRANAAASQAELRRREDGLDVAASDLLGPTAMFTLSHPRNSVLAEVARRVLRVFGLDAEVVVPTREFLGERRAPVEQAVVEALGWPAEVQSEDWVVRGVAVPRREVLAEQLDFYASRPDVVADALHRYRVRLSALGLGPG